MSALATGILVSLAREIGAPLIERILTRKFGKAGGEIAGTVIRTIAEKVGVEESALPELAGNDPAVVKEAMAEAEQELSVIWSAGLRGQFALLEAESQSESFWQRAWRPGWMYLLAFFWIWRLLIVPVINRYAALPIEEIDLATLLTLTSWFLALYMGGHTVKEFGKSIADAISGRGWRA